jgi:hypothetical protein
VTQSKRIVQAREHCNALVAVTDVDVSDHERPGDAAKADATDFVQLGQRPGAGFLENATDIDERGQLDIRVRRKNVQRPDALA